MRRFIARFQGAIMIEPGYLSATDTLGEEDAVRNEPRFCTVSYFCSPNSSKETGDHRISQAEHENCATREMEEQSKGVLVFFFLVVGSTRTHPGELKI